MASDDTQLPLATFPTICSYTLAQLLDKTFYPQQ
ncbi:hypothetical protein [Chromatium okenii]|nr:hypothetical protein [Chromatium okenii]